MGLRDARRAAAAAPYARRSRPVARRACLLCRKPARRERQGEAPAGVEPTLPNVPRRPGAVQSQIGLTSKTMSDLRRTFAYTYFRARTLTKPAHQIGQPSCRVKVRCNRES